MNLKVLFKNKSAQVWVETVIYTLIGLTIIAIILAVSMPAIERYKDQLVVEQTITVMSGIDSTIKEVRDAGTGNQRLIPEIMVKKGKIEVDARDIVEGEKIVYSLEKTRLEYSEPGQTVNRGNLEIFTEEIGTGKYYNIRITLRYSGQLNLVNVVNMADNNDQRTFTPASVPYKWSILNNGIIDPTPTNPTSGDERIQIKIESI